MSKTVSVVITAFNHSAYIRQALHSVLCQAIAGIEIILVDDGSTDDTYKIAQEFSEHGVHAIRKVNGGPSSAVNVGVARSSGEIIVLFSADDVMAFGSVERRLQLLKNGPSDIVCSLPEIIGGDGFVLPSEACPIHFHNFGSMEPLPLFTKLYFGGNFICAPSVALTRSAWDAVGPFDESLWQLQDYDYWLRASALGLRIFCLTEPCISYRWHGSNLSSGGGSLTAWESDLIQARAPRLLSQSDMLEILFGSSFRTCETSLSTEDCSVLIRMRHGRPSVAAAARLRFQELVSSKEGSARFREALT